jgi:hypothetical protein
MTTEIINIFCVIIVTAIFFVWGKIRSDIAALCSLLALRLFGYFAPEGCGWTPVTGYFCHHHDFCLTAYIPVPR